MAVLDTQRIFKAFIAAGFSEDQAQALVDEGKERYGELATKADLKDLATKSEVAAMRGDTEKLRGDVVQLRSDMEKLEMRLLIKLGALMIAVAGLQAAILGFLLALLLDAIP